MIKDGRRFIQGYNAQAAVTEDHIVVASEVTNAARDSVVFETMLTVTEENLVDSGGDPVGVFVAHAGYWSPQNATCETDADVLIAPMPASSVITEPDRPAHRPTQGSGLWLRLAGSTFCLELRTSRSGSQRPASN